MSRTLGRCSSQFRHGLAQELGSYLMGFLTQDVTLMEGGKARHSAEGSSKRSRCGGRKFYKPRD